jgi:glutamate synthase (NADPH/NADH) small chain
VIEQSGHGTVTIGSVEKYITDTAWENDWVQPIVPAKERAKSVGIIGAGPGGLAAADMLRRAGLKVTVYDRYDRAGGLLTYGIPGFKLEKDVVMRRVELLEKGGVEFKMNCNVGEDITFEEIRSAHDAVIIATGVYKSRDLQGPGSGADGIVRAIDYLTASNRASNFGDTVPEFESGELNAKGKKVVVIGGGDTAMDCVRTAIRQGAESVKCLYRRDRANMPGSQREVQNAEEEGVEFVWLANPHDFSGDPVTKLTIQKMRLGAPDASGRQSPELIEGSDYSEDCDLVIKALGFEPEDLPTLWDQPELAVTRWGTIRAEFGTGKTSLDGVYAIGDIVRGASLVVWAIRDGRDCVTALLDDLNATKAVAAE